MAFAFALHIEIHMEMYIDLMMASQFAKFELHMELEPSRYLPSPVSRGPASFFRTRKCYPGTQYDCCR